MNERTWAIRLGRLTIDLAWVESPSTTWRGDVRQVYGLGINLDRRDGRVLLVLSSVPMP